MITGIQINSKNDMMTNLSQGNSLARVYVKISTEGKILLTAISRVCYGTDPKLDENRDPKSGFHAF